jgi:hypothetical protein
MSADHFTHAGDAEVQPVVAGALPWFTTSLTGIAMFGGMLGYMLYRRDMYAGGYSFHWLQARLGYA